MTLARWGDQGDGGKWLCGLETFGEGCIVFSLGSQGQYDFENSMLGNTPCEVHTFDCTFDGHSQGPRHHYHKLCLGSPEKASEDALFVTLTQAMKMLDITTMSLLKMDIEGFEYDVMATWQKADPLPSQISFELHWDGVYWGTNPSPSSSTLMWKNRVVSVAELALFMNHLAHLGYAVVSKENNVRSTHCSEFTMLRVRR